MTEIRSERLLLRTPLPEDLPRLTEIHREPDVARWWDQPGPDWIDDDPGAERFAILAGGEVVGLAQYFEECEPMYRHAGIDLFISADHHGRGIGTETVTAVVDHLVDQLGHHRITIDPAVDNHAAIRCYEKAGFRRVGILEQAERDPLTHEWRDSLMMELVRRPGG